ncbi:aspartyl-phosphate phosphatase Spo0E family protein [Paenibacillus hodogayensis]|uniref:Aspartyl-phosphate phosphatase Spo0E family protein n=1 Tax=Paenibacillus hodogayensis TaxID=279208 RepID=A0ABV5VPB0_9BACL
MSQYVGLHVEIDKMKKLLERTAKEYMYNFRHPQVVEISQQLDRLIVKVMRHDS